MSKITLIHVGHIHYQNPFEKSLSQLNSLKKDIEENGQYMPIFVRVKSGENIGVICGDCEPMLCYDIISGNRRCHVIKQIYRNSIIKNIPEMLGIPQDVLLAKCGFVKAIITTATDPRVIQRLVQGR
jgi:hypothetical protein